MNLYIVRHGQSAGNVEKSIYFKMLDCNIPLTKLGRTQAVESAKTIQRLTRETYNYSLAKFRGNIFYSFYKRAEETAKIIYDALNKSPNTTNIYEGSPVLREREWGGLRDIVNTNRKTEEHFNFFYKPTDGESFANAYDRVASFHQWLMMNHSETDNIVVAHGEFNKLYAMYLMRWSLDEFNKWRTPRNGEVMLFIDGKLSWRTPLTEKIVKNQSIVTQ